MRNKSEFIMLLAAVPVLVMLFPGVAHAYLDAGTGSLILQVALAGILTALYTAKVYWQQLKIFVAKRVLRKNGTDGQ
jgi:hypothetical protein